MRISPGCTGAHFSVVVDEFDIFGTSFGPRETDSPLIVDPDAVLPDPITSQRLQPVARRHAERVEEASRMDLGQLPDRGLLDARIDRGNLLATPQPLRRLVSERPDHVATIYRSALITLDVKPELHHVP